MDAEMDVYDIQVTSNFRVGEIKRRKNTKMKGYSGCENFTIGRFDKVNAILKGERLLQPLKILMIVLTFWNDHFTFVLLLPFRSIK